MQNATKRGKAGLPSGAGNLVSNWVFCTISAKNSAEKFLRLELCVLLSFLLSLGTVRSVLLSVLLSLGTVRSVLLSVLLTFEINEM